MSFDAVVYRGVGRRNFHVAVYFDGLPTCGRVGPLSRADAYELRRRVLSAGDDAVGVGRCIEYFKRAIRRVDW